MGKMGPPLRQADCDGLQVHPGSSSSKRPRTEDDDATSLMIAGAKISRHSHVSASDQARQHIGDVFHGPVTLQHVAATTITATRPTQGAGCDRLMESLVFKEMDARFVDVHPNLVGTCEWLPKTHEYKSWMDPELMSTHHGFFWIKGKAGAGKSTLMKHASTYAEARCSPRQHVLNFFFHARGGSLETSTDGLFRSLLHQLLEKVPAVFDSLNKRRLGLAERQGWSSTLLKDTFREAVLSLDQDQVTCFIDAMDECRQNDIESIIQYFDNLGDALVLDGKAFHVCLSSRHYPNLRSSKSVELVLENQNGHDEDIRRYIKQRLLVDSNDLGLDLAKLIGSRACGVFLWVVLVVALVNQDDRNGNATEIYQRLDQIPMGLSDLFNELIERGTKSNHFRPLLQWVAFSNGPLTPVELFCILNSDALAAGLVPPTFNETDLAKYILSASKGLVETTKRTQALPLSRVQFVHESLRTYFLGESLVYLVDQANVDRTCRGTMRFDIQELAGMTARCHDELKERCLNYLVQIGPPPSIRASEPSAEMRMRRRKIIHAHPFLFYAMRGVMRHANNALELGLPQQRFLDSLPCNELNTFRDIMDAKYDALREPTNTELWYKAYTAARFGCPKLLKAVLEAQTPFEATQWQWNAILCASIRTSDFEGVSTALQAGADPNAPSLTKRDWDYLGLAVHRASIERYGSGATVSRRRNIIELLLKHGARPYTTTEETKDCLYLACRIDGLEVVLILLGEHLKSDTQCSHYGVSLARAVGQTSCLGNDEILKFLLDKGAETGWWSRATLKTGRDASLEVTFGDISIVRLILAEDPQVIASSGTPTELKLRFKLTPE